MASSSSSPLLRRLVIGLILALCLGVGEFWLYAAHQLGRYVNEQTFGGASLADFCASSDIGGFPFRLRLSCADFSAPMRTAQGDILARAQEAHGEASLFAPNHVVLTLSSPIVLLKPDGAPLAKLRHDGMTLDFTWSTHGLEAADLAVKSLDWRPEAPQAGINFDMQTLAAEAKPLADGSLHFDLAGQGVTAPLVQQWLQATDLGQFKVSGRIAPAPRQTGDWRAAVEDWRRNSGAVSIEKFDWRAGDLDLRVDGALALDDAHRAAGRLNVAAKGAGPIFARLGLPVSAAQAQNLLGALLGKPAARSEDGDAIALPLVLAKGQVFLGPLRLPATLAPLY